MAVSPHVLDSPFAAKTHKYTSWLFFIEGSLTVFFAICAIFILPDFPSTTRWLSPLERKLALLRMEEDVGVGDQGETEHGAGQGFWLAVSDWRVWWLAVTMTAYVISLSFNAFFPTLSATLGYGKTVTLLLCAPPFVFSAIVTFFLARCVFGSCLTSAGGVCLSLFHTAIPTRWRSATGIYRHLYLRA